MPDTEQREQTAHEDKAEARRKPSRLGSLLLTLATIGTILGGVLAAFQIYERVYKDESDTKHLELQAGASLEVPKDWEVMDSDAIQVMTSGMDPRFDALLTNTDAKCLQFIGPKMGDDNSGVVCVVLGKTVQDLDYDVLVADMSQMPGVSLCKKVELANGTSVHFVCLRESIGPDGYYVPITQDCYVFIRGDDMWMLMFMCEDYVYMRESASFAKIAASLEVD